MTAPTPARCRAVKTYRARQEAKGLKRVTLFVPRDREDEIKQAAAEMREDHAADDGTLPSIEDVRGLLASDENPEQEEGKA